MTKYTITFERDMEKKFKSVLARLDESEYTVVEEIHPENPDDRYSSLSTVMEMDSDSCLTFRMAMGNDVKIRRERTEEELAEEEKNAARHRVTITVQVDQDTK